MTSARLLMLLAGVMYAASWCVPVATTSGELMGGDVWGWQAFLFTLMNPALGNTIDAGWLTRAWMVASALSNALVLVAIGLALRRSALSSRRLGWAFAAATLINAVWIAIPEARSELRLGYYLWFAAFALGAIGAFRGASGELA